MSSITDRPPSALPYWPWGFVAVAALSPFIIAAPLAAYVLLIALFGLPHVLCELRYCDQRFSARLSRRMIAALAGLLALVAAVRVAQAFHVLPAAIAVELELALGAGLALTAASMMNTHRVVGAVIGLALAAGIAFAPIATFLLFAWLHNLTPLAFVAEIVPARERARTLLLLTVPFLLFPALIATGGPGTLLHMAFGLESASTISVFGAGHTPFAAFLPPVLPTIDALPLFAAAVVAQTMHYFAVIVVLPSLVGAQTARTLVPWPAWPVFYAMVAAAALLVFALYTFAYPTARAAYGVAAALHSWVELPIFLLALGAGLKSIPEATRRGPTTLRSR